MVLIETTPKRRARFPVLADQKLSEYLIELFLNSGVDVQNGEPMAWIEMTGQTGAVEKHVYQSLTSSGVKQEGAAFAETFDSPAGARDAYRAILWEWMNEVGFHGKTLYVREWPSVEESGRGQWIVFSRLVLVDKTLEPIPATKSQEDDD